MNCRSRIIAVSGIFIGLLAVSTSAAPPFPSNNSRTHGNEVYANVCTDNPAIPIQRCADVSAWEHFDNKGSYEFTGIAVSYSFYRPQPEGGWRTGWRWISCQAGLESIKAQPNNVRLDAVLHPDSPECDSWGSIEECDASWNCEQTPWGFPEPTVITGEWLDPLNTSKAVINRTDSFYDPWSEVFYKTVNHCKENWGDLMSQGGFTIDFATRIRHFPFEGYDTQGWSNFWLRSCNDNFKAK